ncbi:MAG: thiopurine S-methyltransferase [Pseudomonadota bacterium]
MEADFWHSRWKEGRIAFHEGAPNRHLTAHFAALDLTAGAHVFLPLCGKTVDIDWLLSQGLRVSGIELNREAVLEVFERLALVPEISEIGGLTRFAAGELVLWFGDFFALQGADLGPVDAIYDRAALVALPAKMRPDYAKSLGRLCPGRPQFLISYDYDQSQTDGPPFSVPEAEIRSLYRGHFQIERLASAAIEGPLRDRCTGREEAWRLTPIDRA